MKWLLSYKWLLWYVIVNRPIIKLLANFTYSSRAELPHVVHWSETYEAYCEYVWRRHMQVNCTYDEVKEELIYRPFRDGLKEFEKKRDKHLEEHGAWWE